MKICIFEDNLFGNLEPLSFSRPVFELVCGMNSLLEKFVRYFSAADITLIVRPELANLTKQLHPKFKVNLLPSEEALFINGRILSDDIFVNSLAFVSKKPRIFTNNGEVAAAYICGDLLKAIKANPNELFELANSRKYEVMDIEATWINYPWDLLTHHNSEFLIDAKFYFLLNSKKSKSNIRGTVFDGVNFVNKENIFIADGASVKPGTTLDASSGPIIIEKNAQVFPNSVIQGPVYIGENSIVKSLSWIYENVFVGKFCKVGGEIEHSIILPYSNKQHTGFLGHAYLGSWVNLGADTNCSDLKNNYSTVKVYINGKEVDTKSQFLGLIMGDHSKSSINSMFNTGTIVGFSCNIFGADFPPKYVPSFSWGGSGSLVEYDINKSLATARIVMQRRNQDLNPDTAKLFSHIFEITENERRKRGNSN